MDTLSFFLLAAKKDILYLLFILARVSGLFLISPFFSHTYINRLSRLMLSFFLSILIALALYPDYRGDSPRILLPELQGTEFDLKVFLTFFKEMAIGYLIGFAFAILYEGLVLAGQLVSYVMGFSASDWVDPMSNISPPMIVSFFTLVGTVLLLSMDFHHIFIRIVAESFLTIPLGHSNFAFSVLPNITKASGIFFSYGVKFAIIPLIVLTLVTISLAFLTRMLPEMNTLILMIPIKILLGYYTLVITLTYFPFLFREAFIEFNRLSNAIIKTIYAN